MHIHRIELPTPLPVGPVNAFFLAGDLPTLIDAGPKTDQAQTALEEGLGAVGHRIEDIRRIILTHGHIDHFGGADQVRQRSGAQIYAHNADRSKFEGRRWFVDHLKKFFAEAGLSPIFLEAFVERLRDYRKLIDPLHGFSALEDGDDVDLGPARLRVLHCPGHSQGHICLYHDDGALIAGDLLLEGISPNPVVEFTPKGKRVPTLPQYLHSLRRVLLLNCNIAYPGHGEPLANPSARVRELIAHHEQRKEEIRQRLSRSPKTLLELCQEIYQDLDQINTMLALSEVIGHLDMLAEEKRVSVSRRGRRVVYRGK